MPKVKTHYRCSACGYLSAMALGRCPECSAWGSFTEEMETATVATGKTAQRRQQTNPGLQRPQAQPLSTITLDKRERQAVGMAEVDRVLGGGLMPASYILLGGDPGIGKSTLVLQLVATMTEAAILYVAGEESSEQIKHRADRLGLTTDHIWVYPEIQLTEIIATIQQLRPALVVIDSIQAIYHPEMDSGPGTVSQIRECAGALMQVAKTLGVTILLIGHVTKDGQLSGPKLLEHLVDVVLTFEGDKYQPLRILRAVKNRFGSTQEIGLFEMTEQGLEEVSNPSERFIGQARTQPLPGSAITVTLEGHRPLLVEVQALVSPSAYASPRRLANGVDLNRMHQVLAVVEKHLGIDCSRLDVYMNAIGGFTVEEPAADLAMALALVTSWRQVTVQPGLVVVGEVGLTGEIRRISGLGTRLSEISRLGFVHLLHPVDKNLVVGDLPVTSHPVSSLLQALQVSLQAS